MEEMLYHKIQSLYKRDPENKFKTFLDGQWSVPEFEYLKDAEWEWTEKVDGTNIRIIWDGESVHFGGRKENSQMHAGLVEHLRVTFTDEVMASLNEDQFMLCGEGFGAKIQKGGNYCQTQRFVLFDVFCGMWLERENVEDIAQGIGCPVVPIVGRGTLAEAVEYVKFSPDSAWGDFTAEGIVMRPSVELQTRRGHRIITKLKVRDF